MQRVSDKDNAAGKKKKKQTIKTEIPSEYCQSAYLHALLEDVSSNKASSVCYFSWPIFLNLPIENLVVAYI